MTDLYPEIALPEPNYLASVPPSQDPVKTDKHLAGIAVGIGGAFIAYRALYAQMATSESTPLPGAAKALLDKIWNKIAPLWMKVAVPVIISAYQYGSTSDVTYDELSLLAAQYAESLGDYLHSSSAEAVLEGFNAQLNSGWSESLAWKRAAEAYGLDKQQMRSYVKSLGGLSSDQYQKDIIPAASRALLDKALLVRAELIGTNEAYTAAQTGKALAWMVAQARGDLPQGTKKRWVTAHDERVCPACGPLDQQEVYLHERFENQGAKFIGPGVHPNCRCTLELIYPDLIVKNMPNDPYNRNRKGWFAHVEQRSAKPAVPRQPPARGKPVMEREPEKPEEKVAEEVVEEVPNPFTANPFVANPFEAAAASANPFQAETPNPFTITTPSPFVGLPGEVANPFAQPFTSLPKQKIYIIHRLVKEPGKPPHIIKIQIKKPGNESQDATIYVNGFDLFHAFNAAKAPVPDIEAGSIIDMDSPAKHGQPHYVNGYNETLGGDHQHGLGLALDTARDFMNAGLGTTGSRRNAGLTPEQAKDQLDAHEDEARSQWTIGRESYIRDLSDSALDDIYDDAGATIINEGGKFSLPWGFRAEDIPTVDKQTYMLQRIDQEYEGKTPTRPWLNAYLDWMSKNQPGEELIQAREAYADLASGATGIDRSAAPTIFRFNGFYGDWEKQMTGSEFDPIGTPRGRYIVESPTGDDPITVMSVDQLPQSLLEALGGKESLGFDRFRIVDLMPLDRSDDAEDVEKKLAALFRRSL